VAFFIAQEGLPNGRYRVADEFTIEQPSILGEVHGPPEEDEASKWQ
jgi:hypothetical protein